MLSAYLTEDNRQQECYNVCMSRVLQRVSIGFAKAELGKLRALEEEAKERKMPVGEFLKSQLTERRESAGVHADPDPDRACQECAWAHRDDHRPTNVIECRRYPVASLKSVHYWCGEYRRG